MAAMDIIDKIEWEIICTERARVFMERRKKREFALAYVRCIEGLPLRTFGEVVMVCVN